MKRVIAACLAVGFGPVVQAQTITGDTSVFSLEDNQEIGVFSLDPDLNDGTFKIGPQTVQSSTRISVSSAPTAVLKGLDKVSGLSEDIEAQAGETFEFGGLSVEMSDCRYPIGNPNSDAFVQLVISDRNISEPVFDGWMVASSPALNALDHARYDIWAIRCKTGIRERTPEVIAGESSPRPLMRP